MSAQRRVVTVLFADVVGSTGIAEELDPEDLQQLLANYYRTAREVIEAYGGTIEKFVGDAVMAIFGAPIAHDDDARRAIAAGLELRQRIRSDPRLGDRLPIRIGINTGEVASGVEGGGGGQTFVAGDAVNVAARLQQQAQPWSVLVGERTARAAAAAFAFGPPIDVAARGRNESVSAREVITERLSPPSPTPFVGREGDLEELQLFARRAFAEGRPWLVTIVAPPGTGKTRLLSEFLEGLPTGAAGPLVVVARCLPYGERLAYQPLRQVANGIIGVDDDMPGDELLRRLRAWLVNAGVSEPDRTAELLAATVGAVDTPLPIQPNELFGAWRTFVEAAARQRPIVLAVEDLHWSSDSLLDLLEFAMQPRADVPALLIAIARPELFDRRAMWSSGRHNQTTIDLAPLADQSVERIVRHLLPSADAEAVASVVERAEGNPFFALEIARSMVEGPMADKLPDTVQATIQARLDRLEPTDRRVIEAGAIFGRSFHVAGIVALTGLSETTIRESIDLLIDRGLVTAGERDDFLASHILIRDVAYNGLPRAQRAVLHGAAADWLEKQAPAEHQPAELIAVHYREAAAIAAVLVERPPELEGVRELAVTWLVRAADRALAAAASTDAVDHLQAAVELAVPDELPALYERMGDASLNPQAALMAYGSALEHSQTLVLQVDDRLRLVGKLLLLHTRSQGGVSERLSSAEMEDLLRQGTELEKLATDELAVARFLVARAFVPFWMGGEAADSERDVARTAAQRGQAIAERLGNADLRSAALDALGSLAETWPDALVYSRERLSFAHHLELAERIDAHSVAAWAACVTGELREAEQLTAAGMDLLEPGQVPSYALHLVAWRINALRLLGLWDELESVGQQALELWEATGRSAAGYATRGFADLLEVCRARGDEAGANRFAGILEEIYRQFPEEPGLRRNEALVVPQIEVMADYLVDVDAIALHAQVYGQIDGYERVASRFLDEGGRLDGDAWQTVVDASLQKGCRIMAIQALRAVGLARSSADQLGAALDLAVGASASPLAARLMIELGRLRGDTALTENGLSTLRELGDTEHLSRLQADR